MYLYKSSKIHIFIADQVIIG